MNIPPTVHASAVLLGDTGILLRGAPGSGKSSLVLALLEVEPERARLVADDRVILAAVNGRLLADVPGTIAGLVEMRGVGILRRPYLAPVVLGLVVDLVPELYPRLPAPEEARITIAGITLPRLILPLRAGGAVGRIRAIIDRTHTAERCLTSCVAESNGEDVPSCGRSFGAAAS